MRRIQVALAQTSALGRRELRELLSSEPDLSIVAETPDGVGVQTVLKRFRPDVLVVDHALVDNPESVRKLRAQSARTRILVLIEQLPPDQFLAYLTAGARGFMARREAGTGLVRAIRAVAAGEIWAERKMTARVVEQLSALLPRFEIVKNPLFSVLTPAERSIAERVAKGHSNKEVADELGVSEKTVKNHLTTVFQKLHCRNRTGLTYLVLHRLEAERKTRGSAGRA